MRLLVLPISTFTTVLLFVALAMLAMADDRWTVSFSNAKLEALRKENKIDAAIAPNKREDLLWPNGTSRVVYSTWMLFEVTEQGDIELVAARPSHHPPSPCRAFPTADIDGHVVVSYKRGEEEGKNSNGAWCHIPHGDPRKVFHDDMHPKTGKFHGGIHRHERTHFAVSVHKEASTFETVDLKHGMHTSKRHFLTQDHHRNFHTLQNVVKIDATGIVSTPLQVVGPVGEQKSIVFVSSGYTAADEGKFDADVQSLLQFLQLPDTSRTLSSQPYLRYFSTINFFQVFHPSVDSGASHPSPAGSGQTVNNNLDCSYGASSARILTCSRAKVHLAASYAPPDPTTSLSVVLVNDATFGGTGGSGICSVYVGDKTKVVFIHEVGHAAAGLADEYDYGTRETKQVSLPNCHWSNNEPPWNAWILAGILPRPTPVCTYSNYYKATPSACLMESDQPSMCPVCAATVLSKFYSEGMNLAAPRFPSPHEVIYVEDGQVAYLYSNNRVPYHKDETGTFTTAWLDASGNEIPGASGTHILALIPSGGASANGTISYTYPANAGSFSLFLHIQDNTNMVLAQERARLSLGNNYSSMRQIHEYRIRVYSPGTPGVNCTNRTTPYRTSYCGLCDAGQEQACALQLTSRPLESALDVGGELAALEAWLLGVGGAFVLLGLLSFFLIWKTMSLHAETVVKEILPLTPCVKGVRIGLMLMQMLLLLSSTLCIIFSAYMYTVLSVFGRTIILGIIAVASIVWFSSFVGFCASYYKNRAVLFFNFVLLLLLFGCALLFTCMLLYVLFNIDTPGVQNQLHAEWKKSVKDDPPTVCTLQSVLYCSGFNTSCVNVNTPAGTSDCPANCETSNQIGYPCFRRIREFVLDNFAIAAAGGGVLSAMIFITMVLALVVGCSIKTNKLRVVRLRHSRAQRGEAALSEEEVAMLRDEFAKIDKDGSGDISREEFSSFYNAVMGSNLNPRQLEEYFDKLDTDQSGTLDFDEFVKVYTPPKKTKKRTLSEAKSSLYAQSENGDGTAYGEGDEENLEMAGMGRSGQTTQQSQRKERPADIELDLVVQDDDDDIDGAMVAHNSSFSANAQSSMRKKMDLSLTGKSSMGATLEKDDINATGIDLDDDDGPTEEQIAATVAAQEARAQEDALAMAKAHADRQKRIQQDRPSNIDVELVMDDLNMDDIGLDADGGNLDDYEAMDLEIDLDNETY